jgi:hypothetical protein
MERQRVLVKQSFQIRILASLAGADKEGRHEVAVGAKQKKGEQISGEKYGNLKVRHLPLCFTRAQQLAAESATASLRSHPHPKNTQPPSFRRHSSQQRKLGAAQQLHT